MFEVYFLKRDSLKQGFWKFRSEGAPWLSVTKQEARLPVFCGERLGARASCSSHCGQRGPSAVVDGTGVA